MLLQLRQDLLVNSKHIAWLQTGVMEYLWRPTNLDDALDIRICYTNGRTDWFKPDTTKKYILRSLFDLNWIVYTGYMINSEAICSIECGFYDTTPAPPEKASYFILWFESATRVGGNQTLEEAEMIRKELLRLELIPVENKDEL